MVRFGVEVLAQANISPGSGAHLVARLGSALRISDLSLSQAKIFDNQPRYHGNRPMSRGGGKKTWHQRCPPAPVGLSCFAFACRQSRIGKAKPAPTAGHAVVFVGTTASPQHAHCDS